MRTKITLTESQLRKVIAESVKKVLYENDLQMVPQHTDVINEILKEVRYIDVSPERGLGAEKPFSMRWEDYG